jgi:hypothetical protein
VCINDTLLQQDAEIQYYKHGRCVRLFQKFSRRDKNWLYSPGIVFVRENNVRDCSKVVSLISPGLYDSSERNVCIA